MGAAWARHAMCESALSVLCTYMLLLNAAFTVLMLLVSSVVRFLAPADTQNVNVP
jgi:hypothetical protein